MNKSVGNVEKEFDERSSNASDVNPSNPPDGIDVMLEDMIDIFCKLVVCEKNPELKVPDWNVDWKVKVVKDNPVRDPSTNGPTDPPFTVSVVKPVSGAKIFAGNPASITQSWISS